MPNTEALAFIRPATTSMRSVNFSHILQQSRLLRGPQVSQGLLYRTRNLSQGSRRMDSTATVRSPSKRVFPPLYKSTGDASLDRLAFFHVLERLKVCKYQSTYCSVFFFLTLKLSRRKSAPDGLITTSGHCLPVRISLNPTLQVPQQERLVTLFCTFLGILPFLLLLSFSPLVELTRPPSIADHMYRMALLAMCSTDTRLDMSKYV